MNRWTSWSCRLQCVLLLLVASQTPVVAEIQCLGVASVPGTTRDASDLSDTLAATIPHNLFGAISAIDYCRDRREYVVAADRGPFDGAAPFHCRIHRIRLAVDANATPAIRFELAATTRLFHEDGRPLSGSSEALTAGSPAQSLRYDPEGLRTGAGGALYLSDEYGPSLAEFDRSGHRRKLWPTPAAFSIAQPSIDPKDEDRINRQGRAANAGWEGLAITPEGDRLLLATQKSLLQDRGADRRPGQFTRLLELDLLTERTRQLAYPLDDVRCGLSEIVALSATQFLSLERDGQGGHLARTKRIYQCDMRCATDVTGIAAFEGGHLPQGVTAVEKRLLIDLLDPRWKLAGDCLPEKWEGLTFGPTLPDGRRLLIIVSDNDYVPASATLIVAFAIDASALPQFGWPD